MGRNGNRRGFFRFCKVRTATVILAGSLFANVVALVAAGAALHQSYITAESLSDERDSFRRERAVDLCLAYTESSRILSSVLSDWLEQLQDQLDSQVPAAEIVFGPVYVERLGAELKSRIDSGSDLRFFSDEGINEALLTVFEQELRAYLGAVPLSSWTNPRAMIENDFTDIDDKWGRALGDLRTACQVQMNDT